MTLGGSVHVLVIFLVMIGDGDACLELEAPGLEVVGGCDPVSRGKFLILGRASAWWDVCINRSISLWVLVGVVFHTGVHVRGAREHNCLGGTATCHCCQTNVDQNHWSQTRSSLPPWSVSRGIMDCGVSNAQVTAANASSDTHTLFVL